MAPRSQSLRRTGSQRPAAQVNLAQQAKRSGTAAVKNRANVSAAASSRLAPEKHRPGHPPRAARSGGGVVHGPRPRDYSMSVPKKVRKAALCSVLSLRKREDRRAASTRLSLAEPKTKLMVAKLRELGVEDVLIVTRERDHNLELAGRNLPHVRVLPVIGVNVRDGLLRKHLVLVGDAVAALTERLQ